MPNNYRYPLTLKKFLDGDVDLLVSTVKAQLTDGYTPDAAHDFLDDVPGGTLVDTAVTLTGKTTTDGKFSATVPDFTTVAAGPTIDGVVFYVDTGSSATSPLICFIGRKKDGTSLAVVPDGGDIRLTWLDPIFSIGG